MDLKDFLSLQEAYLEVYNNLDLDEELTGERKERADAIATQKTKTDAAGRKKRDQARWLSGRSSIGKEHPSQGFGSHPDPEKSRAPKNTIANHKSSPGVKKKNISRMGAGRLNWKTGKENVAGHGMPQVDTLPRGKGSKAARRAAALKKEQVDIYDIILSHLLDEGYAETPEAAEAIMVNMSEEWRDSIVEERVPVRKRGGVSAPEGERSIGGEANRRNKDYWASVVGRNRDRGAGSKAKRRAANLG